MSMSRETGLTTADVNALEKAMSDNRDLDPHEPIQFE